MLRPLPGDAFDVALVLVVPGGCEGPDLCPAVLLLGAGPVGRPPGGGRAGRHQIAVYDGAGSSPGTPGRCTRAPRTWCWITTWRCWPANRARSPARPRWSPPGPGVFTVAHQRFWDAARAPVGDGAGTRALIGVLLLHRTLPAGGDGRDERRAGRPVSIRTWSPSRPAAPATPGGAHRWLPPTATVGEEPAGAVAGRLRPAAGRAAVSPAAAPLSPAGRAGRRRRG